MLTKQDILEGSAELLGRASIQDRIQGTVEVTAQSGERIPVVTHGILIEIQGVKAEMKRRPTNKVGNDNVRQTEEDFHLFAVAA